jgi:hypothetical protein
VLLLRLLLLSTAHRDTTELQLISTAPGAKVLKRIASNPLSNVNSVEFDQHTWEPQLVAFNYLQVQWQLLDPALKAEWGRIEAFRPGEEVAIIDRTFDEKVRATERFYGCCHSGGACFVGVASTVQCAAAAGSIPCTVRQQPDCNQQQSCSQLQCILGDALGVMWCIRAVGSITGRIKWPHGMRLIVAASSGVLC